MPKVKRIFTLMGIEIEVEIEDPSEMVDLSEILPKPPEPPE